MITEVVKELSEEQTRLTVRVMKMEENLKRMPDGEEKDTLFKNILWHHGEIAGIIRSIVKIESISKSVAMV